MKSKSAVFLITATSATIIFCSFFIFVACHKQEATADQASPAGPVSASSALIAKARQYFESNVQTMPPAANAQSGNLRAALHKIPIWNLAISIPMGSGNAVVVPLAIKEPLFLKRNAGRLSISAGLLTYLMIYSDSTEQYHAEVLTKIPDDNYEANPSPQTKFTGIAQVEDWQGNFIRGYHFSNGEVNKQFTVSTISNNNNEHTMSALAQQTCIITDWYNCVSDDGGETFTCTFDTETTLCTGGSDGGGGGGGNGTVNIYQSVYRRLQGVSGGTWSWGAGGTGPLCQSINFSSDGNGNYIANMNGLSEVWTNAVQGSVSINFTNTCITCPSSGKTTAQASTAFCSAFNYALNESTTELNKGTLLPQNIDARFITLLSDELAILYHGSTWNAYSNCSGSAPNNGFAVCQP